MCQNSFQGIIASSYCLYDVAFICYIFCTWPPQGCTLMMIAIIIAIHHHAHGPWLPQETEVKWKIYLLLSGSEKWSWRSPSHKKGLTHLVLLLGPFRVVTRKKTHTTKTDLNFWFHVVTYLRITSNLIGRRHRIAGRHFCIAAALGLDFSLKLLMNLTEGRFVSKEVFAATPGSRRCNH